MPKDGDEVLNTRSIGIIENGGILIQAKNFNTNKPIDYVMSKSSIPNLTKYIAINFGRKNIRSNCVVPHGIKNLHKKDFVQKFSNLSPIGRMSDVKEVIGPIIFLYSNASSYMTGSTLIVDGGWTAW